jgi:glycerophosphoryl diester phosphodiesterase
MNMPQTIWARTKIVIFGIWEMNQHFNAEKPPWVIGHRGACGHAPENTLASLHKAADMGAQCVEFDIKLTVDLQPVLFHDTSLRRTSNGKGKVSQYTFLELQSLDAGAWYSSDFLEEQIPSLVQAIQVLETRKLGAMIELKPTPGQEVRTAEITLRCLEENWPESLPTPMLISFSEKSLRAIKEVSVDFPLGLNVRKVPVDWKRRLDRLGANSLHCRHQYLTRTRAEEIISTGTVLRCFTVNSARRARTLASWGVHGIFSNFPDRMPKLL